MTTRVVKELILLRHAKSSWEYNVADRNRTLTEKGMARITAIAKHSHKLFEDCDAIFSSPANRALHTAVLMMHTVGIPFEKLNVREHLYTFEASHVMQFVQSIDDAFQKVICVGHNPAFTIASEMLGDTICRHLPTAGWAHFVFKQDRWSLVKDGQSQIGIPKELLK